jgi:transcriptional regulator of acetoin/glycerol metabolism
VAIIKEILHRDLGENYTWPGNVREMEQAVRRILLSREYKGHLYTLAAPDNLRGRMQNAISAGNLTAGQLLANYCALLYQQHQNIEEVARRTQLDRRTVKKYLQASDHHPDSA